MKYVQHHHQHPKRDTGLCNFDKSRSLKDSNVRRKVYSTVKKVIYIIQIQTESYPKHKHFWEGKLQVTDRRDGQETWTGTSHSHSTEVHSGLCPERRIPSNGTRKMPINVTVMLLYNDQNWRHWNSWQYWVLDHEAIGYNMYLHSKRESAEIISIHI